MFHPNKKTAKNMPYIHTEQLHLPKKADELQIHTDTTVFCH